MIDYPKTREESELNHHNWKQREDTILNICKKNFQLVYFGHLDYGILDEMTVIEREIIYDLLRQQKDEEAEFQKKLAEERKRKMKSKRK